MVVRLRRTDMGLPPPEMADARGLVAIGGDLSPQRLLHAYRTGIFPWYEEGLPILWHSPDPRMVLRSAELRVNRSLRKVLRRAPYRVTLDERFDEIIERCATVPRPDQDGTWITREMIRAYIELHELGHAHCVAAWEGDTLVGGVYGVGVGAIFCGESMFADAADASKVAFVHLVQQLRRWEVPLVDCQVHTPHLARFGAEEWPREAFLEALREAVQVEPRVGRWTFDEDFRWDWPDDDDD